MRPSSTSGKILEIALPGRRSSARLAVHGRRGSLDRLSLRLRLPKRMGRYLPRGNEPHRARSPVVDLSHGVPPLDVRAGAVLLADSLPYLNPDAVVLAIVDPSVGRDRDVGLESNDGGLLVGPDNGLLAPLLRPSEGWPAPSRSPRPTSS